MTQYYKGLPKKRGGGLGGLGLKGPFVPGSDLREAPESANRDGAGVSFQSFSS